MKRPQRTKYAIFGTSEFRITVIGGTATRFAEKIRNLPMPGTDGCSGGSDLLSNATGFERGSINRAE